MQKFVLFTLLICFIGSTVKAQQTPEVSSTMPSISELVKSITSGGETSVDSIMESVTQQMAETPTADAVPLPATDVPLIVEETVPHVNRAAAEAVDTKTGRYPPRLKIDFTEFPLRPPLGKTDDAVSKYLETAIANRIQTCFPIPDVRFEFDHRTVKLTGSVKTERQRELAELLIRLEPGIDTVKNEIKVK